MTTVYIYSIEKCNISFDSKTNRLILRNIAYYECIRSLCRFRFLLHWGIPAEEKSILTLTITTQKSSTIEDVEKKEVWFQIT